MLKMLKSFFVSKIFCSFTKNLKTNIMKTIKRLFKEFKQKNNLTPIKVIELNTGVICKHYSNGKIIVL